MYLLLRYYSQFDSLISFAMKDDWRGYIVLKINFVEPHFLREEKRHATCVRSLLNFIARSMGNVGDRMDGK